MPLIAVDPEGTCLVAAGAAVFTGGVWVWKNAVPRNNDWLTSREKLRLNMRKTQMINNLANCPTPESPAMLSAIANCPIVGKWAPGGAPDGADSPLTINSGWAWKTKVILSNDFFERSRCAQSQTLIKECYQRAALGDYDDFGTSDNRSREQFGGIECCLGCCGTVNPAKYPSGGQSCCPCPEGVSPPGGSGPPGGSPFNN